MSHPIYTVGDTSPSLTGTVYSTNEAGDTVLANLTGATVLLHLRKPSGSTSTETASLSATPEDGTWSYSWSSPLDETGLWMVEAQVTFAGGDVQTFGPSAFRVLPQIA